MQPMTDSPRPPPPPTADKRVPAVVLRMILEGIREVSGSQFPKVLAQAGLERYAQVLPPSDQSPTITEPELSKLYGATFRVAGESLTRLFLTQYGQKLPEALLNSPSGQQMVQAMEGVPQNERLGRAVHLIAETGTKLWVEMSVSEDQEAYYLSVSRCAICADMHQARSPICANSEIVYGALARALTGMRVTALEIECAAAGGTRCRYRLRK